MADKGGNLMPRIAYTRKRFGEESQKIIGLANQIIVEYEAQGFVLTLRQLYYQFVARGWIENRQSEYKRLGGIINDGRLAGHIDWDAIEDRTRNLEQNSRWSGPEDIMAAVYRSYHIDLWKGQDYRPEVWIEKEALVGVIERVCRELDVAWFACRGYNSQSEQWRAGMRLKSYAADGQTPVIFHLGDHDPSGLDMTLDNSNRLSMFFGDHVQVVRLALNMDQVREYNPPPNPAKMTDSRFQGYADQYGLHSWELDALEPSVIVDLIRGEVLALCDEDLMAERIAEKEATRETLLQLAQRWDDVEEHLRREVS